MRFLSLFAFSILGCLTFVSCQRSEVATPVAPVPAAPPPVAAAPPPAAASFRVNTIDLGNALGAGDRIATPSSDFHPSDTIYASVVTDGASPSVSLTARWTYGDGQLVSESTRTIAPTGPAATEFHISKPDGWPAGHYKVEITANGVSAGSREFEVK
jgi:hypothetical protein